MERQVKSGLERISSKVKRGAMLATAISALTLNSGCAYLTPPKVDPKVRAYEDKMAEEQKDNAGILSIFDTTARLGYILSH